MWDWVWRRRVVYYLTLFASLFLTAMPLIERYRPGLGTAGPFEFLLPAIDGLAFILPDFTALWLDAFRKAPERLVYGVLAVGVLLSIGGRLQGSIRNRMRAIWRAPNTPGGLPNGWLYWLRTRGTYRAAFYVLKHWILPTCFAAIIAAGLVLCLLWIAPALVSRFAFGTANTLGFVCRGGNAVEVTDRESNGKQFETRSLCTANGTHGPAGQDVPREADGSRERCLDGWLPL